jgi:hypothetical protein
MRPPRRWPADAVTRWERHGFVVLRAYLAPDDLRAGVGELGLLFPSAAEYATDADPGRNAPLRGDEYGGLVTFPFTSVELSLLAVHPSLLRLARALLGRDAIRIYSAEAWAKYTGAAVYEQDHHRDFLNHTVVVPSDEPAHRNLELFVFLHEVGEDLGPTHVVSSARTDRVPLLPHVATRVEHPDLYAAEVSAAGPAGTVLAYRGETMHRATELTAPGGARFTLHCSFRPAADEWVGRQGWGDRSFDPAWEPFVNRASVEQLALFGFPPPGHRFWTPRTLDALEVRYPRLDTRPWRAARRGPGA